MGLKLRSNRIPALTFSNLPASVDEGQSISPIISFSAQDNNIITSDLSANIYWEISGVGIASTDFENVGADGNPDSGTTLTGYVNLTGTTTSKQFAIGIRSDNFTDLNVNETATFSIYSDAARTELIQSDTFIINDTSMGEPEFDFLLVGGGGRGGSCSSGTIAQTCAGGGGAGGVLVVSNEPIGIGSTIYCRVAPTQTSHANGFNSFLSENDASGTVLHQIKGGGKGATDGNNNTVYAASYAADPFGASGGGGAGWEHSTGASSGSYGNDGGNGSEVSGAGGGGGYATAGGDYGNTSKRSGSGGVGYDLSNFFSELEDFVAGGGGGGAFYQYTQTGPVSGSSGTGGLGGGGDGASAGNSGDDAEDNTGSGGGGASPDYYGTWPNHSTNSSPGGDGGSGVIYLKYIAPEPLFTYSGGTQTVNSYTISVGGGTKKYWVHKLTSSGTLTRVS